MTLEETLKEMNILFNWSERTYQQYNYSLKQYLNYYNYTFEEMIKEAETDEENIRKINKRRIKKRLVNYQLHLKQRNLQNSSITSILSRIKQVYKYEDIDIPEIPSLKIIHHETYKDLITTEQIKNAITNTNTKMRAVITFLGSSGLRRSDMVRLTIKDFLNATKEYHNADNIPDLLEQLQGKKDIIPTWEIVSKKTNISHITFNSPEATIYILQLLKERLYKENLTLNSLLFGLGNKAVTINLSRLNDRLGYGWNVTRRKFHAHALRTFFSTTLTNNGLDYLSTEFLLGHKLNSVQQSYYYANPDKLKVKYSRYVDKLTFIMNVEYVDITNKEKQELEYLRAENKKTMERLRHLEDLVDMINSNL